MDIIYNKYREIITNAAEQGLLTEEMKAYYLSELETPPEAQLNSTVTGEKTAPSGALVDNLEITERSGTPEEFEKYEKTESYGSDEAPAFIDDNLSSVLSDNDYIFALEKSYENNYSSPQSDSENSTHIRNQSDDKSEALTPITVHLENKSKRNKILDFNIPIYVDIKKKKAIIKPKASLSKSQKKKVQDTFLHDGSKEKSVVFNHEGKRHSESGKKAVSPKNYTNLTNRSVCDKMISYAYNDKNYKKSQGKVKDSSHKHKNADIDLLSAGENIRLGSKFSSFNKQTEEREGNSLQEQLQNVNLCDEFKTTSVECPRKTHKCENQGARSRKPNWFGRQFPFKTDPWSKSKPRASRKTRCAYCGEASKHCSQRCETSSTGTLDNASDAGDGKYDQLVNVNIVCKFYPSKNPLASPSDSESTNTIPAQTILKDMKSSSYDQAPRDKTKRRIAKMFSGKPQQKKIV